MQYVMTTDDHAMKSEVDTALAKYSEESPDKFLALTFPMERLDGGAVRVISLLNVCDTLDEAQEVCADQNGPWGIYHQGLQIDKDENPKPVN